MVSGGDHFNSLQFYMPEEAMVQPGLFSYDVLNALPFHICVLDKKGNIVFVNQAWLDFAYQNEGSYEQIGPGLNYLEICRRFCGDESDEQAFQAFTGIRDVLQGNLTTFEMEYSCHSPTTKRWYVMRCTRMYDIEPRVVIAHVDVTEKKLHEIDLRQNEAELQALYSIHRSVSSKLSQEEVIRSILEELFKILKPDYSMFFLKEGKSLILKDIFSGQEIISYRNELPHRVGECLCGLAVSLKESVFSYDIHNDPRCTYHECKAEGIRSFASIPLVDGGEVLGCLGLAAKKPYDFKEKQNLIEAAARDVGSIFRSAQLYDTLDRYSADLKEQLKERKRLEAALIHRQKLEAIGTLAGGIAHDFNNILAAILGFTELAMSDAKKGSTQLESLEEVLAAGGRARDLVRQILTCARKSDEESRPVMLHGVVTEVLKLLRPSTPSTIEINTLFESKAAILGNQSQIHQVVLNLCTNAVYAMKENGGTLDVQLREVKGAVDESEASGGSGKPDCIELKVTDTGSGIESEIIHKVFDPYFTTKGPGEGTGMGLAVTKGIVDNCGGEIDLLSTPGEGSSFTVRFPVINQTKDEKEVELAHGYSGTEHILLVDDEESVARMGCRMLETMGYKVTKQTSATAALELFKNNPADYDLVVTDMTMPGLTGDNLSREILKIRGDMPILLTTGFSHQIDDARAEALGIRGIVYKPFKRKELGGVIRKTLHLK